MSKQSSSPERRCPLCDHAISVEKSQEIDGKIEDPERFGRPIKPALPGERVSLGLKVTAAIKERLDRAARESGRTQSQEAEARIDRSFDREDLLPQVLSLAYGREMAGLLMMLGHVIRMAACLHVEAGGLVRRPLTDHWLENPEAFAQVVESTVAVLNAFPSANTPHDRRMHFVHRIVNQFSFAWRIALDVVHSVSGRSDRRGAKNSIIGASDAEAIRSLLGPIASHLHLSAPKKYKSVSEAELKLRAEAKDLAVADAVLALINASPRTPSREEIARAVRQTKVESGP